MDLRTYQAFTMAEALAAVKRDLGSDAVILHTRTFRRSRWLGLRRQLVVEVTASTAAAQRNGVSAASRRTAPSGHVLRAYAAQKGRPATLPKARSSMDEVTSSDVIRTRRLAQAMLEQHERRRAADQNSDAEVEIKTDRPPTPVAKKAPQPMSGSLVSTEASAGRNSSDARRFILQPAARLDTGTPSPGKTQSAADQPESTNMPPNQAMSAMQEELAAIRTMVSQVLHRQVQPGHGAVALPQQLFELYLRLIGQEVSEELADRIMHAVRDELSADELDDPRLLRESVCRHLAAYIPVAAEPAAGRSADGRPLTIVLVGPTGVGKTTTLAKLAATFKLRQHLRVGLITADTYRIAAVDQLQTYAEIIGVSLQIARTPAEMKESIRTMSDCDVVLIDTAGRGQHDDDRLRELRRFLEAADPHEVHLVLSSTASEKALLAEAESFSRLGIDRIVLTKLDEAVSFGVLVNVMNRVGKDLSFITTGQEVPDHIEVGQPRRLAEFVLEGAFQS